MIGRVHVFVATMGIAACGPGEVGPDAGGGNTSDAEPGDSGLVFVFSAPDAGQESDNVLITSLRLRLEDVRAAGDAGPSSETYLDATELQLEAGTEASIAFRSAPPGRYSAFEFDLRRYSDADAAWEIRGQVQINGETYDLEIEDDQSSSISLPLDALDLGAGQTVEVAIVVDLGVLIDAIDWDDAPIDDGKVVIDDNTPGLLDALHDGLLDAFSVASITPIE